MTELFTAIANFFFLHTKEVRMYNKTLIVNTFLAKKFSLIIILNIYAF